LQLNVHVTKANYPRDVSRKLLEGLKKQKCQKIVIGVGQWPASKTNNAPTLFLAYEKEMRTLIKSIKGIKGVFLRSVNYNPLGDMIGGCPPTDWRSPPVIDEYNRMLKRLCNKYGVEFIDTNFIIGPVWDSARDWCHYRNKAGEEQAFYIAGKVLGLL
jgi:hypothetical protein